MTIVVAASAPDGLVIAADSRAVRRLGSSHRITSDSAEKVFVLHKRFMVGSYGLGHFDRRTLSGWMDEYRNAHGTPPDTLEDFARTLGAFFAGRLATYLSEEGLTVSPQSGTPLARIGR